MLVTCWSVKGGSGTTVVASALAVLLARSVEDGALLVDAGGDVPACLGLAAPSGPGLADWLRSVDEVDDDSLPRLGVDASAGLRIVPRGDGELAARPERVLGALAGRAAVVIDAGPPSDLAYGLAAGAGVSLLVLRPCYLALRRALAAPIRPSGVVVIEEPRRSLDAGDVEDTLGVPVAAVIPWDHSIARCVDAGLLAARMPRALSSALRAAA